MTYLELYDAALAADKDFQAAIEKQFGKGVNRFAHSQKQFNTETRAAQARKHAADKARYNYKIQRGL